MRWLLVAVLVLMGARDNHAVAQGWSPSPPASAPAAKTLDPNAPILGEPPAAGTANGTASGGDGSPSAPTQGRPPGFLGELRSPETPAARAPQSGPPVQSQPWRQQAPSNTVQAYPYYGRQDPEAPQSGKPQYQERGGAPSGATRPAAGPPVGPYSGAAPARRGPAIDEALGPRGREVERSELAPVMSADGSGLPSELWNGMSVPQVEEMMARLTLPPRSAALHDLWRRLVTAKAAEPAGGKTPSHFLSLRLEALYRSGLLQELEEFTASGAAQSGDPVLEVQRAKALLGLGQADTACERAKSANYQGAEVPKSVARDALLIIAYCAAAHGNPAAASLTADLAREQGFEAPLAYAIIDHLASGGAGKPQVAVPKDVSLIDYRFLELAKLTEGPGLLERAEPALLSALARETKAGSRMRVEAAEDAARIHALDAQTLGAIYKAEQLPPADQAPAGKSEPPLRRARIVQVIANASTPAVKARAMSALLADARSASLYVPAAQLLLAELKSMTQSPELASFAETAVEIALAGGDDARAVSWALFGSSASANGNALLHWMTLIDIAGSQPQVPRGSGLKTTQELALRGKFSPEFLHRLVTVLDALEYDIPIPLWDAASRTPQPAKGYLPETGVLAQLKDASAQKKFGLTVLLAMRTLGPDGAEGANVIALGDAIRALMAAGLEADARRLGFEALFPGWPRAVTQ